MDVVYKVACGLDVHFAMVMACLTKTGPKGGTEISDVCSGVSGRAVLHALSEGRSVVDELPRLLHRSMHGKLDTISAALEAPLPKIARAVLAPPRNSLGWRSTWLPGNRRQTKTRPQPKREPLFVHYPDGVRWCGGAEKRLLFERQISPSDPSNRQQKKARMAIARKLMILIYQFLGGTATYKEPEQKTMSKKSRHKSIQKRVKDLEAMGFQVVLTPISQVP